MRRRLAESGSAEPLARVLQTGAAMRIADSIGSSIDPHAPPDYAAPHPDIAGTAARPDAPTPGEPGREMLEREAGWRRGRELAEQRAAGGEAPRDPYSGIAHPEIARHAFATLAENVRDYAIFLLNPDGIITFWGEGARLIKWWTASASSEGILMRRSLTPASLRPPAVGPKPGDYGYSFADYVPSGRACPRRTVPGCRPRPR